mmetsp:Transcript_967/g.1563  ORF Transcript_967/g.1563 Transcript_967/m.1563 type:complete len:231 (-) Transcript_967:697-1389(-)
MEPLAVHAGHLVVVLAGEEGNRVVGRVGRWVGHGERWRGSRVAALIDRHGVQLLNQRVVVAIDNLTRCMHREKTGQAEVDRHESQVLVKVGQGFGHFFKTKQHVLEDGACIELINRQRLVRQVLQLEEVVLCKVRFVVDFSPEAILRGDPVADIVFIVESVASLISHVILIFEGVFEDYLIEPLAVREVREGAVLKLGQSRLADAHLAVEGVDLSVDRVEPDSIGPFGAI